MAPFVIRKFVHGNRLFEVKNISKISVIKFLFVIIKRFTDKIIGIDEKDIAFQKVLTDDEILKMPVIENNKMIFVEPPEPEPEIIE